MKNKQRVLFLDIDGVLNTQSYLRANWAGYEIPDYSIYLQEDLIHQLNRIMSEVSDLQIVIHSSWGRVLPRRTITAALKKKGFAYRDRLLGLTEKRFSSQKVHEIGWWLSDHQHVSEYLIIDDDDVGFNFLRDRYNRSKQEHVVTDSNIGLSDSIADRVIAFFNR